MGRQKTNIVTVFFWQSITMTTLLDLKSSVLRQVQRSQSLRSRRETASTASSPLTQYPEPLPRRWVAEVSTFMQHLTTKCWSFISHYSYSKHSHIPKNDRANWLKTHRSPSGRLLILEGSFPDWKVLVFNKIQIRRIGALKHGTTPSEDLHWFRVRWKNVNFPSVV